MRFVPFGWLRLLSALSLTLAVFTPAAGVQHLQHLDRRPAGGDRGGRQPVRLHPLRLRVSPERVHVGQLGQHRRCS